MRKLRDTFYKLKRWATGKLATKLVLLFATIIIATVGSMTFISYRIVKDDAVKNIISSSNSNLKLVNKNFEKYFKDVGQRSFPQYNYDNFMNAVANEKDEYTQRTYLENYLRSLISERNDIERIYLYITAEHKYYCARFINNDLIVTTTNDVNLSQIPWYQKLIDNPRNTYIQSISSPEDTGYPIEKNKQFIIYHRVLRNIADRKPMTVISLCINSTEKDDMLRDIPKQSGEHTLLLNSQNRPFYIDDEKGSLILKDQAFLDRIALDSKRSTFFWEVEKQQFLVVYNISENDKWKLIKLIPYSHINKVARINSNVSLLIGMIFLVLSILLIMVTAKSITSPLDKLSKKMNSFGKGNLDIQININGNDETAQLARQFNDMVGKINELINEQYKMKLVQKNAILKALEAELNPHFLYNALQAISTEALKNGAIGVSEMVDALSMTFRYCINGTDIVQVRDEIKHVENYIVIQKARFGDRLAVVFELDEAALDFEIPKLSIQGLIENSVKHAVEKRSIPSLIHVKVSMEGKSAKINVSDNGPGMESAVLDVITESLKGEWTGGDNRQIGLMNLNTRLKLLFGEAASIQIKSDDNGTQTSIVIPERSNA